MKNSKVWILWLIATMILILSTRNPTYIIVTLIGLLLLGRTLAKKNNHPDWTKYNLRFLLTMVLLSTLINGLFTHIGRSVLFRIPSGWPLIGGPVTMESLTYGAINGLIIGALYLVFTIINNALNTRQLTRLVPRVFHPIAMMITISLTFFPSIQQRAREIKEAQMIRGNPMKKMSDWIPIFIPLLVTSLEKAVLLSESMTTRGFHTTKSTSSNATLISLILATFSVFSGWLLNLYDYPNWISIIFYASGLILLVIPLFLAGQKTRITRYHQERWEKQHVFLFFFYILFISVFVFMLLNDNLQSLSFTPYPSLSIPPLQLTGLFFYIMLFFPIRLMIND